MDPARVDVVLVRPARPGNVAAACRALRNMGLHSLRLVEPPPGLHEPEARNLAYGAWDVLDGAQVFPDLPAAVADATLVAGTSGRRREGDLSPRHFAAEAAARTGPGRLALVFGPESSGLSSRELALCHVGVHVPTDISHPSLNLAQAVLVLAYELRLAWLEARERPAPEGEARASAGEMEAALAGLREGLLGLGYLNPENPEAVLAELRALLARARPTPREVSLLRGLARQLQWSARQIARPNTGTDNPEPASGGRR